VARHTSKRSRRSRQTPSPVIIQDENSIASCSTLNTAFIDIDPDYVAKWQPDISSILPDDVIKRNGTERCRKPEVVVAAVRQVSLCERKFVDDVGDAICRLSRPLLRRRDVLTSQQYSVLFQNLEKVCLKTFTMLYSRSLQ